MNSMVDCSVLRMAILKGLVVLKYEDEFKISWCFGTHQPIVLV